MPDLLNKPLRWTETPATAPQVEDHPATPPSGPRQRARPLLVAVLSVALVIGGLAGVAIIVQGSAHQRGPESGAATPLALPNVSATLLPAVQPTQTPAPTPSATATPTPLATAAPVPVPAQPLVVHCWWTTTAAGGTDQTCVTYGQ